MRREKTNVEWNAATDTDRGNKIKEKVDTEGEGSKRKSPPLRLDTSGGKSGGGEGKIKRRLLFLRKSNETTKKKKKAFR